MYSGVSRKSNKTEILHQTQRKCFTQQGQAIPGLLILTKRTVSDETGSFNIIYPCSAKLQEGTSISS